MSQYTIEARSLIQAKIGSHDFWVLRDDQGNFVAELHGMATDRKTGETGFTGTDSQKESLQVHHFVPDPEHPDARAGLLFPIGNLKYSYVKHARDSQIIASGPREEILARWIKAMNAISELNKQNLDYPPYGASLMGKTVNSNSAYRTLGELMGVRIHNFSGVIEPGINNKMQSYSEADHYQHSTQESEVTKYNFNQAEKIKTTREQIRDAFGEMYQGIRTNPFKNVLPKEMWDKLGLKLADNAKGVEIMLQGEDGEIRTVTRYHQGELDPQVRHLRSTDQKIENNHREMVNAQAKEQGVPLPFPEYRKNLEPENER